LGGAYGKELPGRGVHGGTAYGGKSLGSSLLYDYDIYLGQNTKGLRNNTEDNCKLRIFIMFPGKLGQPGNSVNYWMKSALLPRKAIQNG
jgi:hypothetical protein